MNDSVGTIVAALEQELLTLTSLHETLQRESAALSGGNANEIDAAIAAKNEALQGASSRDESSPTRRSA